MFSLFRGSSEPSAAPMTGRQAAAPVAAAIAEGARRSGVDFGYMLKTAERESALNPTAKASTSSARGLYQFIDQTWLAMVKQEGPKQGLGSYADAISKGADGRYSVADPALRKEILALRDDPTLSATMAGAFTTRNAADLKAAIGRDPTAGELYMAHVLGAAGATRLVSAAAQNPTIAASRLFPDAAAANRNLFYHKSGQARSANELYQRLATHHDASQRPVVASNIVMAVAQSGEGGSVSDRFAPIPRLRDQAQNGLFYGARPTPVSAFVQAMAADPQRALPPARGSGPLELGLFRSAQPPAATA